MIGESHRQAETLASEAASALAEGRKLEALELYSRAAEFERLAFEEAPLDKHRTRSILAVSLVSLLYKSQKYDRVEQEIASLLGSRSLLPWAEQQLEELLDSVSADQGRQAGLQPSRGPATMGQRDRDDFLRKYFNHLSENIKDGNLLPTAADAKVDKYFQEGLNNLLDLSRRTFSELLLTERPDDPLTLVGPLFEEIPGVSREDIVVKVGRDGVARFGAYRVINFF